MTTTLGRSGAQSTAGSTAATTPAAQNPAGRQPGDGIDRLLADRVRRRMHLIAVSVALIVLSFVQAPGKIAPDTKADLSIDPVGFLLRAWHLWEPLGDSGQLQNQAYGYFLPMGPFYALGHLLGFPAWVVQRAWWALVLLTAFYGMYLLCQRFGVGNHSTQIIAGLAFALCPRMITEVGPVSIEAWPMALAPWALLPLVRVTPGGEATAAARSGAVIALCGGVNAVAVGAVLPLPFWWLVTRHRGRMRRKLVGWWTVAIFMATFWWLGPLLLLGRYSPPFLDWVESAAVSTSKGSLPSAFRGTTQWVAWFKLPQPIWLAGFSVLSSPPGILLGWVLITLALLGVLRRDIPHRSFVIGGCLGGLFLLTLGHTGPLSAPWAHLVQEFLDGPGAPLRNTHKFDVVLRLPLALGLAHVLSSIRLPAIRGLPWSAQTVLRFAAASAIVGTAAPALAGQLPAQGGWTAVPTYWRQAAAWLQANDDGARTLIVPGSEFATSVWGDPHDEVFQSLARTAWTTRSGVPLSSAGNIRMLTTIEEQLETGRGSAGLAEYLARAGISRVLLRSDLRRSYQPGAPPLPVVVRSALEASPGLHPVARFGPDLSGHRGYTMDERLYEVVDDGLDVPQAAIEIWEVDTPTWFAEVYRAPDMIRVAGGTESLLSLAEARQLGPRPVVLDSDPEAGPFQDAPLVTTDTPQRREANFAQVRDVYSQVMTTDQKYVTERRVHDWMPFAAPLVTARYEGVRSVTASSSAGDSVGPWYAVDGDRATAWTSRAFAVGQWIDVAFPKPVTLPSRIVIVPNAGTARLATVQVTTDTGAQDSQIGPSDLVGTAQELGVPPGETRHLRLTVKRVWPGAELAAVSLAEISLPDIYARRPLVLPTPDSQNERADPTVMSFQNARDGRDPCVFSAGEAVCSSRLQWQSTDSDLDRIFQLRRAGEYTVEATARPRTGQDVEAHLLPPAGSLRASANSRRSTEFAQRPQAAVDRDPGTSFMFSSSEPLPKLTISWNGERTVGRLRWQTAPELAASRPLALQITAGSGTRTVLVDGQGWAKFDDTPLRGERLDITVRGVLPVATRDRATNFTTLLPVGISELVVPALDDLRRPVESWRPVELPCGQGPPLVIGNRVVGTRLVGSAWQLLHRASMEVIPCGTVGALPAGQVRIRLQASEQAEPESLTLVSPAGAAAHADLPATTAPNGVRKLGAEHRVITVDAASVDQILVVHENSNAGWRARLGDLTLVPVRLDGWQQGWIIPAGKGGAVDLRFTPGPTYRLLLVSGLMMVALLVTLSLPQRRRHTPRRRAARLAQPVALPEVSGRRLHRVLGVAGVVVIGGLWGVAALAAVVGLRRRLPVVVLVSIAGATAGIGAAFSVNADEKGFWGYLSIVACLMLLAVLALGRSPDEGEKGSDAHS